MTEDEAGRIAAALRAQGIIAAVARPAAFRFGVRVPIGDGREALWDVDGAAGLEAQIMRDGMLVGFVPQIPGSPDYDEAQVVHAIATADYRQRPLATRPASPPRPASATRPPAAATAAGTPGTSWRSRWRRRR